MSAGERPDDLLPHLVALLFVSSEPLSIEAARQALGASDSAVTETIERLAALPPPGLMLQRHQDTLQLVTAPTSLAYVRRLRGIPEVAQLSKAALEVLALVAYRQPVTRAEIDAVRGVASDRALATLIGRGLVDEIGRRDTVGRPALLGTTMRFLEFLGIGSLDDLPTFVSTSEATTV